MQLKAEKERKVKEDALKEAGLDPLETNLDKDVQFLDEIIE